MTAKNLKILFVTFCLFCLSFVCGGNAYADYAIPGCKDAYVEIGQAGKLEDLATLVKNDCSVMYRKEWRLPADGGTTNREVCAPAWNGLGKAGKLESAKFIVTHNCPVLYRKGWAKCS